MKAKISVKRVYEPFSKVDGYRVLVDRLWPRGMKKEDAHINLWLREIAPSNELRKWFHASPDEWQQFVKKYTAELEQSTALDEMKKIVEEHPHVTLLYSAKNEERNNATVLMELLGK